MNFANVHKLHVSRLLLRPRRSGTVSVARRSLRLALAVALIAGLLLPGFHGSAAAQACQGASCSESNSEPLRTISYAYVTSSAEDDNVAIDWTTAYEIGNIGFNILAAGADGPVQINDELISSAGTGTVEPRSYTFSGRLDADAFYIESVSVDGETLQAGPYAVNATTGANIQAEEVDWSSIQSEHEATSALREAEQIDRVNADLAPRARPCPVC